VTPWLVVPTLNNRARYLGPLLAGARMPAVIVRTDVAGDTIGDDLPGGHRKITVHDVGSPNIHRWWNRGIDYAVSQGADVVVVCNDDVAADPGALLELAAHIEVGGAGPMLVWPYDREHANVRVTEISGYCFALDPAAIRPDETFTWWYGDHDLEIRARGMRPHGGALGVTGLPIRHLRTDWSYDRDMSGAIVVDRAVFAKRYPALMCEVTV
jgi:glycosyltransferase involved in cell wall biosynthesis